MSLVPMSAVSAHSSPDDCWMVINNVVYDLTSFLPQHPGGEAVIAAWAGKDGSKAFNAIHNAEVLKILHPKDIKGSVDTATIRKEHTQLQTHTSTGDKVEGTLPTVDRCLNISDLESVCRMRMGKEGLDYYTSAADDEITLRENRAAFHRIFLRPRVMVNVKHIDTNTTMLGTPVSMPLYISACALGKLAHLDGECALARAAGKAGIIQMCPTLGSYSIEEMAAASIHDTQTQWFQLYVNADRGTTLKLIKRAEACGMKCLCITVDAPVLGRRERDMRNKFSAQAPNQLRKTKADTDSARSAGVARALSSFIDPSLCWDDLQWFKQNTHLPIVLKGIQTKEDALLSVKYGVAGIVVSNHGGRQMDCCRSGIEMLVEIMDALHENNVADKLEVYMDGGVRRGSDIYKALAIGARAVGIGRPALYGLGAYGQEGVERALQILKEEFIMAMMLMGCPSIKDIKRDSCITNSIAQHTTIVPTDHLTDTNYTALKLAGRIAAKL